MKSSLMFDNPYKWFFRTMVATMCATKTSDLLQFLGGSNEAHNFFKFRFPEVNLLSIDSGVAMNKKEKRELRKKVHVDPHSIQMISLYKLAKEGLLRFGTIWLDYCGTWGASMVRDISVLHRIMKDHGFIILTLRIGREKNMRDGETRADYNQRIEEEVISEFAKTGIKLHHISCAYYPSKRNSHVTKMRIIFFSYQKI